MTTRTGSPWCSSGSPGCRRCAPVCRSPHSPRRCGCWSPPWPPVTSRPDRVRVDGCRGGVMEMGTASVLALAEAAGVGTERIGGKAAALAGLLAAGFPVPPGFAVTDEAFTLSERAFDAAISSAVAELGEGPFAVRSSASAEDLAEASYAGLYETFLNVPADEVPAAVRRCHAAATAPRVVAYQRSQRAAHTAGPGMAVLVQPMIRADAAGVAFTADPVTGERDHVVITAVRGLGERLVDGQAVGDEWTARGGEVRCRRVTEHAIDAAQATAVAELARRVQAHAGVPQDIEWAYAAGRLWLLQARPMTALPEPVAWDPPGPGVWQRNFRLGEWLPEPLTPLFADWLLPAIEAGFADGLRATAGTTFPFPSAIVNGWFYATPQPRIRPGRLLAAVAATRGRLLAFMYHTLIQPLRNPAGADAAALAGLYRRWRDDMLPGYRDLVAAETAEVGTATPPRLVELIDKVARTAGCTSRTWLSSAGRPGRWTRPWPASPADTCPASCPTASPYYSPRCPTLVATRRRTRW